MRGIIGKKNRGNFLAFYVMGAVFAIISLIFWNFLPTLGITKVNLSIFSPQGAEVYVHGFRIKHWLIGVILLIIGGMIFPYRREVSGFFMGFGTVLLFDELLTNDLYYWKLNLGG